MPPASTVAPGFENRQRQGSRLGLFYHDEGPAYVVIRVGREGMKRTSREFLRVWSKPYGADMVWTLLLLLYEGVYLG